MKNLTKEQIKKLNEVFNSISGEGLTEKEIFEMYGAENVEFVENEKDSIESNEIQEEMYLKDKIEAIWQYYDCAGFDIKSEQDLFVFLGI